MAFGPGSSREQPGRRAGRWRPRPRRPRGPRAGPPRGGSRTPAIVTAPWSGVGDARVQGDHEAVLAPSVGRLVVVLGDQVRDGAAELGGERRAVGRGREADLGVDPEGRERLAGRARAGDQLADLARRAAPRARASSARTPGRARGQDPAPPRRARWARSRRTRPSPAARARCSCPCGAPPRARRARGARAPAGGSSPSGGTARRAAASAVGRGRLGQRGEQPARTGSSEASAAAGSSMTATSSMPAPCHRHDQMSRKKILSVLLGRRIGWFETKMSPGRPRLDTLRCRW